MSEYIESHIIARFEIVNKIGGGAYGHVWKVVDRRTRRTKALKKNFDAFSNSTDAQRTYREIMFLMYLSHPNIIRLEYVIRAENNKDVYLIFEHMDVDLHRLIRENILAEKHRKYIVYQMAKAIYYLHSAGLVHRDIKPANVLVNESCEAKLCDFGLVRSVEDNNDYNSDILTEYIATRWYRAPEILLGSKRYTKAIDIWSFGCLLAYTQRGKPLFPGKSTANQIYKVLMWTGFPTDAYIQSLNLVSGYYGFKLMSKIKKVNKKYILPHASDLCIDLITRALEFNPAKRLSIYEILTHPYLQEFYNKGELITSYTKIKVAVDDNYRLPLKYYRAIIYEYIKKKNKSTIDIGNSTLYRIKQPVKKSLGRKNDLLTEVEEKVGDAKTVSIGKAEENGRKKSFNKRDILHTKTKHLKTIEKYWSPFEVKSSFLKEDHRPKDSEEMKTKYDWNRKKRSTTESNAKKTRILPSPVEIRQRHELK